MKTLTCTYFFVLLCLCACSKPDVPKYESQWDISFEQSEGYKPLADKVRKISFVCLENHSDAMIYGVDKMRIRNGRIYLGDLRSHRIAIHDLQGNYLANISQKGNAPEEFLEIRNFAVDDSCVYVIDNARHRLMVYDSTDGSYKRESPLPVIADDVERLDNGDFIFAFMPQLAEITWKQTRHLLFVTDSNLQIKERLLPYAEHERVAFAPLTLFSETEEAVCFSSLLFDGFTVIPRSYPSRSLYHVGIRFSRPIPDEYRADAKTIDRNGYHALYATPISCGNYLAFGAITGEYVETYVYDMQHKQLLTNSKTDATRYVELPVGSYEGGLSVI